jgi:signal transduction histidine kinase/ligand-binding sensor domain-containing protein
MRNCGRDASAALALAISLCAPAHALNPDIRLRDYNHAAWSAKDGAPSEIRSMAQTPDGWLWLGGPTGLFRFDGVRFERYELPNSGEVAKRRVTNLRATRDGDLWISFSVGGLSVLHQDGRMEDIAPLDSAVGIILTTATDADRSIWIASTQGPFVHAAGQLRQLGPEQGLPQKGVRSVILDQYQQLWMLYVDGLYRLERATGKFVLVLSHPNQGGLIQSPDGHLWISDVKQITPVPLAQTLPAGRAVLPRPALFNPLESRIAAQFDRDGNLWTRNCPQALCVIANAGQHQGGALLAMRDATDSLSPQLAMTSLATNAILEDMEGNLWVATQSGLDRFRANSLIPERLAKPSASFSMAGDTEGGVWLADAQNNTTWRLSRNEAPVRSAQHYQVLANDRDGALLMSNLRSIERRYRGQVTQIPLPSGADGKPVDLDIFGMQDDGKVLWMASRQTGLLGRIDGHWLPRGAFNLPPKIFLSGAGRKPGERWQATGDGALVHNDNGQLTSYNGREIGLATMIDASQEVVVGGDKGLAVFTGHGFRKLRATSGSPLNNISGMAISADGDRWFNGGQGVVHVRRANWLAALADPTALLQYDLLGALDGYTGQAMLENRLPSVYADRAGDIWFMTSDGVLRLSPGQIGRSMVTPVPQVLHVDIDDSSYAASAGLRLPPGSQNFSVQFTAPGLGKPEGMHFQYQLSGVNQGWQEAGNRRIAYYTNVAPGSYTFRVRASNADGVASVHDATLAFNIEPTFVQTIGFKALCVLGAAAVLYLLYLYRLRIATRRIEDQLMVRMAERERIARTLHDTFLQSVQALILRLDLISQKLPEPTRAQLQPILEQAADTIVEGRDQVYELRTGRVDDIESAAAEAGRQLAAQHPACDFRLLVSGARRKLQVTVAEEACEIAREALRNAYHHANAANAEAHVSYQRDQFVLEISDDGDGMAAEAPQKTRHYGLVGMRERAMRAGGTLEIGTGPARGVRITLSVPARVAYAGRRRWWQRHQA